MNARLPLTCLAVLMAAACATSPAVAPDLRPVVWSGEVTITDDVSIPRGSSLVIEPGTTVRFAFRDDDDDGWGDASIRIEGDLSVRGEPGRPVVFTPEPGPVEPGRWGEIRVDFGRVRIDHAVVQGSTRGLHAHFSEGRVSHTVFRDNIDGTRLGDSRLALDHNLFYGHPGKAYNARNCRNRVVANRFHHNRNGIFLFEADGGSVFEGNWFRANDRPARPGDFFTGEVILRGNDWGGPPPSAPDDAPGARMTTRPASAHGAGPGGRPLWAPAWRTPLGGFVDADPVVTDEGVYAASWDGAVVRVGLLDGQILGSTRLPDVVDSRPAVGPTGLGVVGWDRSIRLVTRLELEPLATTFTPPSPADDHRQAAPVFGGTRLFTGGWDGRVRGFETSGGRLTPLWTFEAGGPFRARLALSASGDTLWAPCQDGTLYALDPATGTVRWSFDAGAPLLSGAAASGGKAVFADRHGHLWARDGASGAARWEVDLGAPAWYAPPLADADRVFQGLDDGRLVAVAAHTGIPLWSRRLSGGIRSRPTWVGEALAVATLAGHLYLLDPATGREWDRWEIGEGAQSTPAVAGTRVIVGSRDNALHALDVVRLDGER